MQHPDEGTIHSWLDNALSAEETARVALHVAECPQCAAAVAQARGFIAASSRILTALDDVPRGVVPATPATPAAPARKRDLRVLWRAAAAVLVVAGGSFIVMRDGGDEMRFSAVLDSARVVSKPSAEAEGATASAGADVPAVVRASDASGTVASVSKRRAASEGNPVDLAAPSIARTSDERQLSANVGAVQSAALPLQELTAERTPGTRRIVYRISATDTVTLTEIEPVTVLTGVPTGVATVRDLQQKTARTGAAAPTRAEPMAAAVPPPQRDTASIGPRVNTIRWVEAGTGKTLVLSGMLSVERLQEIKRRIETERAASGKRTP